MRRPDKDEATRNILRMTIGGKTKSRKPKAGMARSG